MKNRCCESAASAFIKFSSSIIDIFEKPKIDYFASLGERQQPVFIIGAPRTGSTIVYQALTNTFDLLYIDNLVCKFFRNLYFGFWFTDKIFSQKPHNCFSSEYGSTAPFGLRAPSECGEFWYRWLPSDRHYIGKDEMPDEQIKEIRDNIYSVMNRYGKPLLFKNMNAGQRLALISEIAPDAKFIFVKRDPLYTAQSILMTKRHYGMQPHDWWSIRPKNFKDVAPLGYHEQIVKQIFFIEKQIQDDMKYFPADNFIIVDYTEFCNDYDYIISKIHRFIGMHIKIRKGARPVAIKYSKEKLMDDGDYVKFKREIDRLDWNHYSYGNEMSEVTLYDSQGQA